MFQGQDFGFVGPSYQAPDVLQDAQDTINFYLEQDPQQHTKEPLALLGCPGLNPILSTIAGQARCCWPLPGGQQALYVVGANVYLVTIQVPATQTTLAVLSATQVGTLLTNSGPVCIRDNGVLQNGEGGYALIVDGTYGYYYLLSGNPYVNTFTASTAVNSYTLTLPGSLPNGLIVASTPTLSDTAGYIPSNTLITYVDTIGLTITMSNKATGSQTGDQVTLTVPVFGQITDQGFLGSNRVAFIEGWFVCAQPGTRTFYTTGPTAYQILFPGAFFALKDSSSDDIITFQENNRELWLIGERTSEVWYGAGLQNFYFSRIPGVGPQIGCAATGSITRVGADLMWLGNNEQGQNWVVTSNFYTFQRISNHGVEHAISQYPVVSDAIGYAYEEEGHLFYMLTFPTADVTWCYDATTKQWHKRLSFDPATGTYHRHRGNCFMNFADMRLVGDYQTGQLHQLSRTVYTDAGNPLIALRRTPHVWQKQNRQRVFFAQLQIEFTPGVGLQTGQGSNPQAMLRFSNDGGLNYDYQEWATIGAAGETRNRAIWYLLGECRDRVWEVSISDPVPRDIIGATAYMEASGA